MPAPLVFLRKFAAGVGPEIPRRASARLAVRWSLAWRYYSLVGDGADSETTNFPATSFFSVSVLMRAVTPSHPAEVGAVASGDGKGRSRNPSGGIGRHDRAMHQRYGTTTTTISRYAFLRGTVWFANALWRLRGQSGYLLASYCHAPVLRRLLGSYFSLRARRRLMVSCGNTPSISASLSGIALFRYVVT